LKIAYCIDAPPYHESDLTKGSSGSLRRKLVFKGTQRALLRNELAFRSKEPAERIISGIGQNWRAI